MGLRELKTIAETEQGIRLVEENLSDGSKVYSVFIKEQEVACINKESANKLYVLLLEESDYLIG
jgi:hypothetical protein